MSALTKRLRTHSAAIRGISASNQAGLQHLASLIDAEHADLVAALTWVTKFCEDNYRDSDMRELAMMRAALAKAGQS